MPSKQATLRVAIRHALMSCAVRLALAGVASTGPAVFASASAADASRLADGVFQPWQHGANNDAVKRGLEFTIPEVNNLADFHGDLTDPKLVLFVGGNYFFAMAPLVHAFETMHPEYKGRIFWETIPPGLLVRQMKADGTITVGNMTWTVRPDAYLAGLKKVKQLIAEHVLVDPPVPYVTNTLTIMVPKANPAKVANLADLGRAEVKLAMPNSEFEGIARQIKASLAKAGESR